MSNKRETIAPTMNVFLCSEAFTPVFHAVAAKPIILRKNEAANMVDIKSVTYLLL